MVETITLVIILFWLPQAIYQVLNWTYWWQVKEYRFDRFFVFLKTKDGKEKLDLIPIFLKLSILIIAIFKPLFIWLGLFLLILVDLKLFRETAQKRIRKPIVTERVKKILATCLLGIILTLLVYWYFNNIAFSLFIGEVLLLLSPLAGMLWTIPIVNKIKIEEIEKAQKVLKKIKPTVIGITGSYGKTTTKEFVAHFLSQKYETARTEGSENTEFGIARKTYKNVAKGTKFFVVEMGAYRVGEIKRLADIVHPQLGIITGIEEQHLSLFGSLENIKKAKFELIESLPRSGAAIFNYSNEYSQELVKWVRQLRTNLKVLTYYVRDKIEQGKSNADIESEVLSVDAEKVRFKVDYKGESKILSATLPGLHFLENLTCAILVARYFGVPWSNIKKACLNIAMPENTMDVYKTKAGSTIIDDTHNATPLAFESALKYLSYFRGKRKFVITGGIIELGNKTDSAHYEIGKIMAQTIDKVILTNDDYYSSVKSGLGNESGKLISGSENELQSEIGKIINLNDAVVLLEGRLPSRIMELIQSSK